MQYSELKQFFDVWLENNQGKIITLNMDHAISRDAAKTVESFVYQIESVPAHQRGSNQVAKAAKKHLISIKKAIESEKFDISGFGYGDFSNFKNVNKT